VLGLFIVVHHHPWLLEFKDLKIKTCRHIKNKQTNKQTNKKQYQEPER
jgi:hypothetical protein